MEFSESAIPELVESLLTEEFAGTVVDDREDSETGATLSAAGVEDKRELGANSLTQKHDDHGNLSAALRRGHSCPVNPGDLNAEEVSAIQLQYWEENDQDVIVIPSLSFDSRELAKVTGVWHYEERPLFNLIHLMNRNTRVVYLTSAPLDPSIMDYYFSDSFQVSKLSKMTKVTLLTVYNFFRGCLRPLQLRWC
jgi:hypothetical protein